MAQATTRNYYKILGVTQKTKKADLKKKYRELAKKYHPDTNSGSKVAEDKFKIISEAYEILSNAKKRKAYDRERIEGSLKPFPLKASRRLITPHKPSH